MVALTTASRKNNDSASHNFLERQDVEHSRWLPRGWSVTLRWQLVDENVSSRKESLMLLLLGDALSATHHC